MPVRKPRRDRYHHGDLRRALTSAALSLVAEKGPKGFTLTEAARRAGVSSAAPYRHFASKAELLASVAEQGFLDLHVALEAAAAPTSGPSDRVVALGRAYIRWAVSHPDHYQVMYGADLKKGDYPGLAVAAELAFGNLLSAVVGFASDPLEVAGPVWSVVHGLSSLAIGGDFVAVGILQDPVAMMESVVLQVLGATPARPRPESR
jgi:AcrR family transcriptional regulator